ncbi:HD domain-containing protein [bacterium]|nr:HD domain-containing protein [bacterium]
MLTNKSYPSLSSTTPQALKIILASEKKDIIGKTGHEKWGLELSATLTQFHDGILTHVFSQFLNERFDEQLPPLCMIALGGYGRNELNIYSDIDINFIYSSTSRGESDAIHETVHAIVRYLWDIGLEIGHSIRSIDDALNFAKSDLDIKTSFLESRFITGHSGCFNDFQDVMVSKIFRNHFEEFVQARFEIADVRHQQFGRSSRLLEPNLKESAGGLRDIHECLWLTNAWLLQDQPWPVTDSQSMCIRALQNLAEHKIITSEKLSEVTKAFDFILKVRNHLHVLNQRRQDVLTYPMQSKVSENLAFLDSNDSRGVELFMQTFYLHARNVANCTALVRYKLKSSTKNTPNISGQFVEVENQFYVDTGSIPQMLFYRGDLDDDLKRVPALLMKIFLYSQKYHAELSEQLENAVRENLQLINESFIQSKSIGHDFQEIWRYEGQVALCLKKMHDLEFLEHYLPEFGFIVANYNYNVYHAFTTDEHLIVSIQKLEQLFYEQDGSAAGHLKKIYDELSLYEKYQLYWAVFLHDIGKSRGGDHSVIGAELAKTIFDRIGFTDEREPIYFLIRQHLTMEQIAFRRNLKDPSTIKNFADTIQNHRWLKMLYVLTFADMSAANKNVWTEWKGLLLHELYTKADAYLKNKEHGSGEISNWNELDYESIQFQSDLDVKFSDKINYTEITVITSDDPYRLSQICGAMAVCDVSIFDAHVFTRHDGVIIDQFRVVDFRSHQSLSQVQQNKLESALQDILIRKMGIEEKIEKAKQRWKRLKYQNLVATEIHFEDDHRHSIVDIFTSDRVGLLYTITKTLSDLQLNITAAKIGTRLDGVADCFYITEKNGEKITAITRQNEIRKKLTEALNK